MTVTVGPLADGTDNVSAPFTLTAVLSQAKPGFLHHHKRERLGKKLLKLFLGETGLPFSGSEIAVV
jgi:hypothetical protein